MMALLNDMAPAPRPQPSSPVSPVFQPDRRGIVYEGHTHGQPWQYSNAITSASSPADRVDGATAAIDLDDEEINPALASVDQLERLFNAAADDPDLAQVVKRFELGSEEPTDLVVGEDVEDEDMREDGRARTDIHFVNPHEFIADAISDALFEGLSWEAVQGARPKIVLRPTKFPYEKAGKSCLLVLLETVHVEYGAWYPLLSYKSCSSIGCACDVPLVMIGKRCELEILGEAPRTIVGKFGERAVSPEGIRKVLAKQKGCCNCKCLHRWVDALGEEAPIILEAHRHAVAAMSEVARQHFFVNKIKDLLVPKMRVGTHGEGSVLVGKCRLLVLSSSTSGTGSWMLTVADGVSLRAGYKPVKYRVNSNIDLCQAAYATIMGISIRTLQRYSQWAREHRGPANRGKPFGFAHRKTAAARCWLLNYATSHDIMPNSSTKGVTTVGQAARESSPQTSCPNRPWWIPMACRVS